MRLYGLEEASIKAFSAGSDQVAQGCSQSGSESSQRWRWHLGSLSLPSTNLQGKGTSLHQAEHLVSAVPFASYSLSMQSQVPSSTTLPVHKCPVRTHYSGSFNVQTHAHMHMHNNPAHSQAHFGRLYI